MCSFLTSISWLLCLLSLLLLLLLLLIGRVRATSCCLFYSLLPTFSASRLIGRVWLLLFACTLLLLPVAS